MGSWSHKRKKFGIVLAILAGLFGARLIYSTSMEAPEKTPPLGRKLLLRSLTAAPMSVVTLENGVPFDGILDGMTYANVSIQVPASATRLTVLLTNGSGDLDLYLKYGSEVSGASVSELNADADIRSDGNTADERIEITPTTHPALKEGTWYIAVLNLNSYETPHTITAAFELPQPPPATSDHEMRARFTPSNVTPGSGMDWFCEMLPGTVEGAVDFVAAVRLPDGQFRFFTPYGIRMEAEPFRWSLPLEVYQSEYLFFGFPFPGSVPPGTYTFYTVLVRSGNLIFDTANWVSNVTACDLGVSLLSPSQQALTRSVGTPEGFIKCFSDGAEGKRVDETWVYADEDLVARFVNAAFVGDRTFSLTRDATQGTPYAPEDYHFDTRIQDIRNRLGAPAVEQERTVWDGSFKNYVYDGILFGFHNEMTVSVTALGAADATAQMPSKPSGLIEFGRRGLEPATANNVHTGYLFTLASLLGAAAYYGAPGASGMYEDCMNGIRDTEPAEEDLTCFEEALYALKVSNAGTYRAAGILDWLDDAADIADAHRETTVSDPPGANVEAHAEATAACAFGVAPNSVKQGQDVTFSVIVDSLHRIKEVTAKHDIFTTTMHSYTPNTYTLTQPIADETYAGVWRLEAYLEDGSIACGGSVEVELVSGPPSVRLIGPTKLYSLSDQKQSKEVYIADVDGGIPNFTYHWNINGDPFQVGPLERRHVRKTVEFESVGSYTISIQVTDGNKDTASDSLTVKYEKAPLMVLFQEQPTKVLVGRHYDWKVGVIDGSGRYSFSFTFSDGASYTNELAGTARHAFDAKGNHSLTVVVKDKDDPEHKGSVSCHITAVCDPPDCCPKWPQNCGGCVPAEAVCCPDGLHACLPNAPCCGPKCCPENTRCCNETHCCEEGNECCGDGCCPAGAFCCKEVTECCWEGQECCPGAGGCCNGPCCGNVCCSEDERCVNGVCISG